MGRAGSREKKIFVIAGGVSPRRAEATKENVELRDMCQDIGRNPNRYLESRAEMERIEVEHQDTLCYKIPKPPARKRP